MARLRAANPGQVVEVWAGDEARLGLKPVTRRVWSVKGQRPRSCGQTRYEWRYVSAFARPATGDTFAAILPRVRVERMADALRAFAARADPDGTGILVLVVGNAGWHTAERLPVPANVRLHVLPACTPQLQPVEAFWPLVRAAVANDTFDRLGQPRRVIRRRCRRRAADTATVRGAIGFRWAVNLDA